MKTQTPKPELKWNWFKYAGVRSTSVFTAGGRKLRLELNDIFGVKEATKSFDLVAVTSVGVKLRLPIPDSEKLMAKSKSYRGKVEWQDKPSAATIKKAVPAPPQKIHLGKAVPKKRATTLKPVSATPEESWETQPQVITPVRARKIPLLDLDEDYDDVSNLGLDFNSHSAEIVPGGVYVSVRPDAGSQLKLHRISQLVRFLDPDQDFHCTVLYSRNTNAVTAEPPAGPDTYSAEVTSALSWSGHDGAAYLVLQLDSPQLVELNTCWTRLGYTQDFNPYKPHVTLKTGLSPEVRDRALIILNNFIRLHPGSCSITFESASIEPLKD